MARSSTFVGLAALVTLCVPVAACGADGKTLREPVFGLPAPAVTVPPEVVAVTAAETAPPTLPAEGSPEASSEAQSEVSSVTRDIVVNRLFSPANATAQVEGIGGRPTDPVTVDGAPADVLTFDRQSDGTFVAQVWIADEGAHTVCVVDTCGRVYTLAPDAETPEEVVAKIEQALVDVEQYLDPAAEFPTWSVEIGGALSGTGGTTDIDTRTITIYRNRGRSVDEFVRTILHEYGHAADYDRLDDAERVEYLLIRGLDPASLWSDPGGHRLDDWAREPSEDFAEAMVMIWSDGRWTPRTDGVGPPPDAAQLEAIALLAAN